MGKRNYIKSRVQKEVGLCNIVGCPCHLINNTACRGSEALDAVATFNVEVFGIYICFDKSTKRKSMLENLVLFVM